MKLCNITVKQNEEIKPFLTDGNIVLDKNSIKVQQKKRIEVKISFLKTQSGRLTNKK